MSSSDSSSEEEDCGSSPNQRSGAGRKRKKHLQRSNSVFDMDYSSSSSDEFERVPKCLDDLTEIDFKSKAETKLKTSCTSTSPEMTGICESHSDEQAPQLDYYDFTKILQSQEELKHVAKNAANYTDAQTRHDPLPKKKTSSKELKARRKRSATHNPSKLDSTDNEIEELLRVGERIETKPKGRKSKQVLDDSTVGEDMVLVTDQLVSDGDDDDEEPTQDVEIKLSLPSIHLKRRKGRELRNLIESAKAYNESRRIIQIELHKVSLLGYLSHGFILNNLANTDELQALALSVIPNKTFYPPSANTLSYTEKVAKWFNKKFPIDYSKNIITLDIIVDDFGRNKASSIKSLVVMFVAFCRHLGLKCRLLMSLQPCPIKPHSSELMKVPKDTEEDDGNDVSITKKPKKEASSNGDSSNNETASKDRPNKAKSKSCISTKKKTNDLTKHSKPGSSSKNKSSKSQKKQNSVDLTRSSRKKKPNRKVVSSDDSEEDVVNSSSPPKKKGVDVWAEVLIEAEKMWVPTDVVRGQVNNTTAIGNGVTFPLVYVVAWNSDGTIKDLTRRYSPNWLTTVPKLRADRKWWEKARAPWAPKNTKLEKLENKKLDEEEAAAPVPTKIQDCKNHPFYALKRHLLKYEAIYPPDAKPIAFIRGEAVYSRVCVSELHTKETWIRKGKAVRVNEEPYKIVKARPKWDKVSSSVIKDLPLPLFGYWQVDDYIAPPAVDGIVPKNAYGNVEMYRPSMLPAGTVHLQVPGMAKVAKKLGIDFAPAVVGWEYHGGSSHPTIDGVIVCKEHQDMLTDAWNAAVDNDIEKKRSKSHLRAVKNWKRLIRSVIIRRRLEKKYKLNLSNVNVK